MKKIYIIPLAAALALAGCKDFLDIPIEGSVPSTGMDYTKPENIFAPVSAAYASMRSGNAHAFPYVSLEVASDNADKGSAPDDNPDMKQIQEFAYTPTNPLINNLWTGYFDIVSAANYAIEEMPKFEEAMMNDANKQYARECQGEAKVIRAYAYFNLTRMFGRIPKLDRTMSSEELSSQMPATVIELYDFIQQDLKEAAEVLPESYDKSYAGRITRFTALGIKAKTHLYRAAIDQANSARHYDSVVALCDRIIASGRYGLLDNFREVFSIDGENSRESLFELQSSTLGLSTGDNIPYIEYAFVQGPRNNTPGNMQGWGFCTPSEDLVTFYEGRGETVRPATTFLRRGTTTPEGDVISNLCPNPIYNGKVYTPSRYNIWNNNGYGYDHNVRILRYPDILLMYAEAIERGSTQATVSGMTATEALNLVRRRAGLADEAISLQVILDERRAELAMEEDRFFDLVRTGEANTVLGPLGFKANKNELFPIPASQRQLNTNLGQNPGYTD